MADLHALLRELLSLRGSIEIIGNDNGKLARRFDEHTVVTLLELLARIDAALAEPQEPPSARQAKLMALADRIDHERLWAGPAMYFDQLSPEQRDRMDAGVALRRYANLMKPNRWLIFPPTGPVQFSARELDAAVAMAKRHERDYALGGMFGPEPLPPLPEKP